jgi:hypothetical protein
MLLAGAAIGQPDQPDRPRTQPSTQPTDRTTTPTRTTTTTPRTGAVPSILNDLEGVWRVEVMVNADHWKAMEGDRSTEGLRPVRPIDFPNDNERDTDRDRTNPTDPTNDPNRPRDPNNQDDPGRPTQPPTPAADPTPSNPDPDNPNRIKDPFKQTDPNQPSNQPGTRPSTQPGQPGNQLSNQPGMTGSKTFVGYAEYQRVLNNNILQQKIVIPDMMGTGLGRTPQRIDGSPTAPSTNPNLANNNEMFRGMSFLGFDAGSQQYHCVFMDSRSGGFHCDHGTYNESQKRLVFEGKGGDHADKPGMDKGMHKTGNVRVVLEVLSPSQHRVTMYSADRSTTTTPTRTTPSSPATPSTTPGQPRDNNADRDNVNTNLNTADGTIIYQATYTKASTDDAPKYRRLLQEPGTPMTPDRNDLDRTDPNRNDRNDRTDPLRNDRDR